MTTPQVGQGGPVSVIDRVSSLLGAFDGGGHLTLAQIARRTDLPRSSAHRLLQTLVGLGWVERQGNEYGLGLRIFELGSLAVRQDGIHRVAAPIMHDLHRRTGLAVHLSVLVGTDLLHIERVGDEPDRDRWQVGARGPAQYTAAGRALLAHLPPGTCAGLDFSAPPTAYSVRSPERLRLELQKVRDYGVAIDVQGTEPGFASVAATIGPSDRASAAVMVTMPAGRRPDRLSTHVLAVAADIWNAAAGGARSVVRQRGTDAPRGSGRGH